MSIWSLSPVLFTSLCPNFHGNNQTLEQFKSMDKQWSCNTGLRDNRELSLFHFHDQFRNASVEFRFCFSAYSFCYRWSKDFLHHWGV